MGTPQFRAVRPDEDRFLGGEPAVDSLRPKASASTSQDNFEAVGPPHRPSLGLDDFCDEDGIDKRVGIASSTSSDDDDDALRQGWFSWRKLWLFTGPGFLMSIAYLVRLLSRSLWPFTRQCMFARCSPCLPRLDACVLTS